MPKVVTHAVVSSSEQAGLTASARAVLRSYYCLCGDFVLVIQGKLDRLPQRKTDGAYIIRSQPSSDGRIPARKFKLNAVPGQRCLIKRKGTQTLETRQLLNCGRCNSTVAYQSTPPPVGDAAFVYVLRGAITELQGRVPPDAFDGAEEYGVYDEDDLANELDDPNVARGLQAGPSGT
ncbi:hypothetical protein EHS25_007812 [Saitozyma podzolica]|uniref:STEEP1 domain-containing protein n=1 Tax=Saitozyma podzolica TaxID=1890683 RepID=A0A427YQY9_9TREE|nr:hypothetical protein EHS25_007812 [Saitozyma podzolica]